jgi:hypothetical protein
VVPQAIPYTATARFLFDVKGTTSWTAAFEAQYQAASYTKISTIVTFVDAATGKAGKCLWICDARYFCRGI